MFMLCYGCLFDFIQSTRFAYETTGWGVYIAGRLTLHEVLERVEAAMNTGCVVSIGRVHGSSFAVLQSRPPGNVDGDHDLVDEPCGGDPEEYHAANVIVDSQDSNGNVGEERKDGNDGSTNASRPGISSCEVEGDEGERDEPQPHEGLIAGLGIQAGSPYEGTGDTVENRHGEPEEAA